MMIKSSLGSEGLGLYTVQLHSLCVNRLPVEEVQKTQKFVATTSQSQMIRCFTHVTVNHTLLLVVVIDTTPTMQH